MMGITTVIGERPVRPAIQEITKSAHGLLLELFDAQTESLRIGKHEHQLPTQETVSARLTRYRPFFAKERAQLLDLLVQLLLLFDDPTLIGFHKSPPERK
jgi:hypothetical protein